MTQPLVRAPFVAGNWKMHLRLQEAASLASAVVKASGDLTDATLVLGPPFSSLAAVRESLAGSPVALAGQNCFWEDKGAYTGEVSAAMLKDSGCQYVIIGHSERRQYFGETDFSVNKKLKAALRNGLSPIFCLGESLEEREKGLTEKRVAAQLEAGLAGLTGEEFSQIVTAYEPVWAIGTGRTATPGQAEDVHRFIRNWLSQKYGNGTAGCAIIIYGGSVKPDNAFSLFQEKDIDGFLVGGASLEAGSFIRIAQEAINAYRMKK